MVVAHLLVAGTHAMDDPDAFGGIPVCHSDRVVVEHILQFHGGDHVFIYPVTIFFLPAGIENFESRGD